MKQIKSIYKSLLVIFISFNAFGQYGIIEMKNGEQFEMASSDLNVEGDQLRYLFEKFEAKTSVMGIGLKKQKKEYLAKSRLINLSEIKKIHTQGEISIGSRSIMKFEGIKYIKTKKYYKIFYIIEEGECRLLVKSGDGNALYSFYAQKGNEEPYELHRSGTGTGPKYKKRSKKYFADCEPAMKYIKKGLTKKHFQNLLKSIMKIAQIKYRV